MITPNLTSVRKALAHTVKEGREARGFTQTTLCKKTGLSASYLSTVENGRVDNPSIDVLLRLSKALKVSVNDLVGIKS